MCRRYLLGLRVQSVLDVTLAHDAQVSDDLDGGVPQHVVLMVVERLAGRHHDGLARVDSQGVDVLHVAHLSEGRGRQKAEEDAPPTFFFATGGDVHSR